MSYHAWIDRRFFLLSSCCRGSLRTSLRSLFELPCSSVPLKRPSSETCCMFLPVLARAGVAQKGLAAQSGAAILRVAAQ